MFVGVESTTSADILKSEDAILSPARKAAEVSLTALASAPTPLPPTNVTVGVVVYPVPLLVTLIAITEPLLTTADANAPEPPPPVIITTGSVVKLFPPSTTSIL